MNNIVEVTTELQTYSRHTPKTNLWEDDSEDSADDASLSDQSEKEETQLTIEPPQIEQEEPKLFVRQLPKLNMPHTEEDEDSDISVQVMSDSYRSDSSVDSSTKGINIKEIRILKYSTSHIEIQSERRTRSISVVQESISIPEPSS